jgi:hypothetical protein
VLPEAGESGIGFQGGSRSLATAKMAS